jgi:hypothetical protein
VTRAGQPLPLFKDSFALVDALAAASAAWRATKPRL